MAIKHTKTTELIKSIKMKNICFGVAAVILTLRLANCIPIPIIFSMTLQCNTKGILKFIWLLSKETTILIDWTLVVQETWEYDLGNLHIKYKNYTFLKGIKNTDRNFQLVYMRLKKTRNEPWAMQCIVTCTFLVYLLKIGY